MFISMFIIIFFNDLFFSHNYLIPIAYMYIYKLKNKFSVNYIVYLVNF